MSRKPIIAGNWKMNLLQSEAKEVFEGVKNFVKDYTAQELPTIVIAPVFTSIAAVESVKCDCGCGGKKLLLQGKTATGKIRCLYRRDFC